MKALGLGGGAIGITSITTPKFHDLDELMSEGGSVPQVTEKWPWYVSQREYLDTVNEVDWKIYSRYDRANYNCLNAHFTPEHAKQVESTRAAKRVDRISRGNKPGKGDPGYSLRDYALVVGGWMNSAGYPNYDTFLGEADSRVFGISSNTIPPNSPKWEGTPEENSHMMRIAARLFGGGRVGFSELIEASTKKLVQLNSADAFGGSTQSGSSLLTPIMFEDVDKPYRVVGQKDVIPNKCNNICVPEIRMRKDELMLPNSEMCRGMVGKAYQQISIFTWRYTSFIKALGYNVVTSGSSGIIEGRPYLGELAGLGECGRVHGLITPDNGPDIRCTLEVLTDLPMALTNPIEMGSLNFCKTCRKCCNTCPNGALSFEPEPQWEPGGYRLDGGKPDKLDISKFNKLGKKIFWLNHFACRSFWAESDASCSICYANCVFTRDKVASIHEFVKPIVAKTGIFNAFFYNMDRAYGYGEYQNDYWDNYWNNYMPPLQPTTNY